MAKGTKVRIVFGLLKGKLGEIVSVERGVYSVRHSSGTTTFRARELETVS